MTKAGRVCTAATDLLPKGGLEAGLIFWGALVTGLAKRHGLCARTDVPGLQSAVDYSSMIPAASAFS